MKRPIVFISYSWDSEEHKEWVLRFASDLINKYGIDIILDQFELSAGRELTHFMESSIEKSDKVLLILTPTYKIKSEERKGGVGYETSMISQEIFESPINEVKFIPILRRGTFMNSAPKYIKSKVYHPMLDDERYMFDLNDLARIVYDKPKIEKPEFGDIPDFSSQDHDPIIEMSKKLIDEEGINRELDQIINSSEGVRIASQDIRTMYQSLKERTEVYKDNTELYFSFEGDNATNAIVRCGNYSVTFYLDNNVINSSDTTKLVVRYWDGFRRLNESRSSHFPGEEPKVKKTVEYSFDLNLNKEPVWKIKSDSFTKTEISNNCFAFLIESIRKEKSKKFRK